MKTLRLELDAPSSGRIDLLDELKGIAIALIVLYHAGGVLVWANNLHGDLGVDLFVILSGVGLSLGSMPDTGRAFFRRRFLRIYPAYWVVLTFFLAANTALLGVHYTLANVVLHYLGIHGWFGDAYGMSIVDAFWFITLLVSVYAFYWFARSLAKRTDAFLLWGSVGCVVGALALFYTGQAGVFGHMGLRLPGFLVGVLVGRLLKEGRLELPISPTLAAAVALLVCVPFYVGFTFQTVPIGVALMFVYGKFLRPWVSAAARTRLKFLGDHSLEIFLIHQPLIRDYNLYVFRHFFNDAEPSAPSLIIGMAVGFGLTLILAVELRRLLGRFFGRGGKAA